MIDLNKLQLKIDKMLEKENGRSFRKWLYAKRNKKRTSRMVQRLLKTSSLNNQP